MGSECLGRGIPWHGSATFSSRGTLTCLHNVDNLFKAHIKAARPTNLCVRRPRSAFIQTTTPQARRLNIRYKPQPPKSQESTSSSAASGSEGPSTSAPVAQVWTYGGQGHACNTQGILDRPPRTLFFICQGSSIRRCDLCLFRLPGVLEAAQASVLVFSNTAFGWHPHVHQAKHDAP